MAQCKWCNKKGLFLSVGKDGICKLCALIIKTEAESKLRVIQESNDIIEKSKNADTIASRTEVMINLLKDFLKYEERGLKVFNLPVKQTIIDVANDSNQKVLDILKNKFEKAAEKAERVKSEKAKHNVSDKFISYSIDFKDYINENDINYNECLSTIDKWIFKMEKIVIASNNY